MEILNAGLEQAHIISELRDRVAQLEETSNAWKLTAEIGAERCTEYKELIDKLRAEREHFRGMLVRSGMFDWFLDEAESSVAANKGTEKTETQ